MTLSYDFWITPTARTALGFNKFISDKNAYQRATAQFRKEQFDSQATVGDQSLTGWWTRGQLSFHKGGGVLYHEVSQGESIIERFDSGLGIDPFTPGVVSPSYEFESVDLANVRNVIYVGSLPEGDRLLALTNAGTIHEVTVGVPFSSQTVTAIPIVGTDPVRAITGSRFQTYLVSGNTIQTWRPGDAAATTLWTKTDGLAFVGLWYAKRRLWAVDENGRWYVLDTTGGTLAEADTEFWFPEYGYLVSNFDTWALAETPSAVYIGAYSEIFSVSVTVDASTLVPTIGAPVQAAALPNDETIGCLGHHLGYLVIATVHGCRFALVQSDGTLAYGPKISGVNFWFTRGMAARGTRISLGGFYFTDKGVYSFDVDKMVDTLVPASTNEVSLYDGTSGLGTTGALNTPGGLVSWSEFNGKIYRLGSNYADGSWLSSGFHRFGTLDPKFFSSVLVRVGGTGGSIDVYRRDPAPDVPYYSETFVGSVPYDSDADIDLGPDVPVERVGLKFVFNRDPADWTKVPQLLGYQLKALPVPKRQRMVRIPLMLFDYEVDGRTRSKRGRPGDAWDRLSALEALEESNAVVTFEDKETGETGSAYIESVEVDRTAPVSPQSGGFGGTVWLTLRKLA